MRKKMGKSALREIVDNYNRLTKEGKHPRLEIKKKDIFMVW